MKIIYALCLALLLTACSAEKKSGLSVHITIPSSTKLEVGSDFNIDVEIRAKSKQTFVTYGDWASAISVSGFTVDREKNTEKSVQVSPDQPVNIAISGKVMPGNRTGYVIVDLGKWGRREVPDGGPISVYVNAYIFTGGALDSREPRVSNVINISGKP